MRIAILLSMVSSILAAPSLVRAQPCVSGSPGSSACTEPAQPGPVPAGWQPAGPLQPVVEPADDLSDMTHSFYLPTGNLTRAGKFNVHVHELGLYNTISYGLSEHMEISAGAPAFPIIWNVAARLSLTSPDSPLRAVVGGSIWMPLVQTSDDGFEYVAQGTVTLGYQTRQWNIHGSVSALRASFEEEALLMGSVGMVYRTGPKWAVMADLSSLNVTTFMGCVRDCAFGFPPNNATVGMKYMGGSWDVDIGLFIPFLEGDGDEPPFVIMPLVSLHRR